VLYALHPKKRLLDKAKALHEEADRCLKDGDYDKALELFSLAKKWHCTPGILYTRAYAHYPLSR
jgi:pentatricopeptide repeat protein